MASTKKNPPKKKNRLPLILVLIMSGLINSNFHQMLYHFDKLLFWFYVTVNAAYISISD